jgi:hypothetical protein
VRGRGVGTAFVVSLVCGLFAGVAPAAFAAADTDDGRVSLDHWDSSFCLDVSFWSRALQSPAPAADEDARITVIRYVQDIVTSSGLELSLSRRGAPPVPAGRKILTRIDHGFDAARARFELALTLAKKLPTDADPAFPRRLPSIDRRIQQGLDRVIETLQTVHGHTGNRAFDRAILANEDCDYIGDLTTANASTA